VTVVLDSWAILRFLEGVSPAAEAVDALLHAERPTVSWINLGEVFYVVRRVTSEADAMSAIRDLKASVQTELPSEERVLDAARIKAAFPLAYADAFAAATAVAHEAELWTGDPELLLADATWRWRDLR
jgi:predicted nucleic acid-binding protein